MDGRYVLVILHDNLVGSDMDLWSRRETGDLALEPDSRRVGQAGSSELCRAVHVDVVVINVVQLRHCPSSRNDTAGRWLRDSSNGPYTDGDSRHNGGRNLYARL